MHVWVGEGGELIALMKVDTSTTSCMYLISKERARQVHCSLVPRPSHRPAFDCLQNWTVEKPGSDCYMCRVTTLASSPKPSLVSVYKTVDWT